GAPSGQIEMHDDLRITDRTEVPGYLMPPLRGSNQGTTAFNRYAMKLQSIPHPESRSDGMWSLVNTSITSHVP
ncbi:MAG: hypothetical protein ABGX16_15395, partial [Pirellulales bacterium]